MATLFVDQWETSTPWLLCRDRATVTLNPAVVAPGWLPRPEGQEATLLTLEQSLQPSMVPPKPLDRAVKGISARQVHYLLDDLRREVLHQPEP